ncbi:glycoside hydrolase family 3 protein [Saccharata proteae CBS 121410]|uniref:beta-glucosidase n=1 Tax=Saccharata proteae CBS 121410 TaxID=1314787 RepID=A0A9P4LUU9_9PEZI|nr:glycoside hydrolase family 3 protein [Saccharata proteae CBS 121410]
MKSSCLVVLASVAAGGAQVSDWATAYSKANAALAQLTQEDKAGIVTGVGWQDGPCVGNTSPVSSIGYPSLCLQDSPLGVRYVQNVTVFPAGVQAASTWNLTLMQERGAALGAESKALGVNVQLGPVAGPLGKIPEGGRGWEGFSNDPYLCGLSMQATITGMQSSGVQACAKHFIGNEQELNRETMSANIADRVVHELYLWPFADAVNANVASVMCSYNKNNETWSCENDHVMNGLLKDELDFKGYIVSDWNAQHSTVASANAGLDMTMPGTDFSGGSIYWGQNLITAVNNGSVPQTRLDDMVRRILASWYLLGQDQGYPAVTWSSWTGGTGGPNVQDDHKDVARAIARDGIVLLKNDDDTLPLNKPSSLAIIGYDSIVNPDGPNACTDRGCDNGTMAIGWGSGTADFPYLVAPLDAIQTRASADGTTLTTSTSDNQTDGASAASAADISLVFINSDSGESYITVEGNAGDRNNLDPWHDGNGLVAAVAAVGKPVIVVIHSVGPLILESILGNQNVMAIVWAGVPGQESGNGLVDVLYGDTNPGGKLPYTIAKQTSDYGTAVQSGDDDYAEGLYIDYRHFDKAGIEPRYEFGYGLSYTTFDYSSLTLSTPSPSTNLYAPLLNISATITNSGSVPGAEVAQLYIGLPSSAPDSPLRQLRGFDKIFLDKGESGEVSFSVRRKDACYWDVGSQSWVLDDGTYDVWVGGSSRDLRLVGNFTV